MNQCAHVRPGDEIEAVTESLCKRGNGKSLIRRETSLRKLNLLWFAILFTQIVMIVKPITVFGNGAFFFTLFALTVII